MTSPLAQGLVYNSHTDSFEPYENRPFTSRDIPTGPDGSSAKRQDEASTSDLIHRPLSLPSITPEITSLPSNQGSNPKLQRQRPKAMFRNATSPYMFRQRKLEQDSQVDDFELYRVSCKNCRKWIKSRKGGPPFSLTNWEEHKTICTKPINPPRQKPGPKPGQSKKRESATASGASPETSSGYVQLRRTEEERIEFLLSDPHATTVEPHRILCAICRRWIQLRKNSTYCTAPWVQHAKKCASRHSIPRLRRVPSGVAEGPDQDDDEGYSFEEDSPPEATLEDIIAPKRGRGRPRKRKPGHTKESVLGPFPLHPISDGLHPSTSGAAQESGARSVSPPPLRTPSPLPSHPYSTDVYWYPTLPPMSTYYPLYTGSQYNESDDSYSLYFHAHPPVQQGPPSAQGRSRGKPPKSRNSNKISSLGPGTSGSTQDFQSSPGPDGSAASRAWVVWRLKNYSTNSCPMDPSPAPESRSASMQRGGSEISGSGSERPLPMYRSGTWPHLLDPQGLSHTQNLSPYVHPETVVNGKGAPSAPGTHSAQFGQSMGAPHPEDPALVSFNSSAHIPIHNGEAYCLPPPPPRSPLPPPAPLHATAPDVKHDPRFSASFSRSVLSPPEPPKGSDLDSPECRLLYTFKSIAYLFSTSYQGEDDMSLDTLTAFMNHRLPRDKLYNGQEVSGHVAVLGERKQLIFTKEGGVQLLASP